MKQIFLSDDLIIIGRSYRYLIHQKKGNRPIRKKKKSKSKSKSNPIRDFPPCFLVLLGGDKREEGKNRTEEKESGRCRIEVDGIHICIV